MTIEEQIYQNSLLFPEKDAIICDGYSLNYSQLWSGILSASAWFNNRCLSKGDRVVLSAEKTPEFITAYFGAHLSGLICVPVDSDTNISRFDRIIKCSSPKLIMGVFRNNVNYATIGFPRESVQVDITPQFPDDNDIADIMFTTGTTGLPKGVSLSFCNQAATADSINDFVGNTSGDVELLALPISHSFGLGRLRCVLSKGATLVLINGFASMKKFFGAIEKYGVTGFGMVPSSWAYIYKMSRDRISSYADQLKYIEIGSAYMPVSVKKNLMSLLPETRICMHYGLTEASRSTFLCFKDDIEKLESAGRPSKSVEIKIFDESGVPVETGNDGEICVYGPHVCRDYWGLPISEFKNDFYGKYFRTGDWGHLDSDGYLHLVSRKKEIINVGGKKVNPIEVEEVLNSIAGIVESACIGVEDSVMGEVVKAFIVGKDCPEDDTLRKIVASKLENYKVPAFFENVDALPKTPSGKLQRLALK